MNNFSTGPFKSTNRISLLTFFILSIVILAGRFFIPGWGTNTTVYISLVAVFCAVLGIGFLRKVLLTYFSDKASAIILVLVVPGTNFLCLATYEPGLIHPLLFLCYALILWSTIGWQKAYVWKYAIILGLVIAVTISIRLQEISCILIPIFWGIYNKNTFHDRWRAMKQHYWQALVIVTVILLAVLGQLLHPDFLYRILDLSHNPQKNHFTFIAPYLPDVLFSFRKGWLIYTPVMIFSILGFYFLARKNPLIFYSTFLFFIINLHIVSSWSIWWEGESFGQRSMISSYPVLALPLGYFVVWLMQKKGYLKIPLFLLLAFLLLLNLFQTWQYKNGILDASRMTRECYGAVFGVVHKVKDVEKKLLVEYPDVYKEKLYIENPYYSKILIKYDFEKADPAYGTFTTNVVSKSGHFSLKLNEMHQFSPGFNDKLSTLSVRDDSWIKMSGYVYFLTEDAVKGTNLVITGNHKNNAYKYKALSLEKEDLIPGKWNKVTMDWQIPYLIDKDDLLQAYFWYTGKDSVFVDDIQIEIIEPR